jgi:hypothetical protein
MEGYRGGVVKSDDSDERFYVCADVTALRSGCVR